MAAHVLCHTFSSKKTRGKQGVDRLSIHTTRISSIVKEEEKRTKFTNATISTNGKEKEHQFPPDFRRRVVCEVGVASHSIYNS